MTATYTPLATLRTSSLVTSLTFSSIPATYRDLILVCQAKNNAAVNLRLLYRYNGDATAGAYTSATLRQENTTVTSSAPVAAAQGYLGELAATNTADYMWKLDIFDYAQTDKHKSLLSRGGRAGSGNEVISSRWANTAAITSVTIFSNSAENFAIGSSFDLYGVIA